ncbi:MAG: hypothetical protein JWL84_3683 [Rhodospirillales bacterium]|nr:hypothetical protein [Rhodospirillales bacterium]
MQCTNITNCPPLPLQDTFDMRKITASLDAPLRKLTVSLDAYGRATNPGLLAVAITLAGVTLVTLAIQFPAVPADYTNGMIVF